MTKAKTKLENALQQANDRLKTGKVGLSIRLRGNKLSLQGQFPPKPNSKRTDKHQQILSLDVYANPAGIKRAEAEAKKIAGAIACREFHWEDYLPSAAPVAPKTAREVIEAFEQDYFSVRSRTGKSQTTWKTDYMDVLKKLDPDQPITEEALLSLVLATEPDTKARQRACMASGAIAQFLNLEFDAKRYKGNYSISQVEPRNLPEDELIEQRYFSISNPAWQWVYGMIACYGLRNHEIFHLDLDSLKASPGILEVLDGKTGARTVFPCYPEWWEHWRLWEVKLPAVSGKDNRTLGERVSKAFNRYQAGRAYNLRHAWAVRSMLFGMDAAMAAAQMGHSVDLHCKLYHKWITKEQQMKAFNILMARSDRPVAPLKAGD